MTEIADVIIIGGGPAGLTAGLYAARGGLSTLCIERISAGGQLAQTNEIENYPGFPEGVEGWKLAYDMQKQAERFGMRLASDDIVKLDLADATKKLTAASGNEYAARAVIVATGARPRKLGIPGEQEFSGHGVSYCATCDGNFFKDKVAVVVGGGNTAAGDALYLARICKKVYLVHRRDSLRATRVYHNHLMEAENIEICWNTTPERILGEEEGAVYGLEVKNQQTGETSVIDCAAVFVAVGLMPNTEFLYGTITTDDGGYVVADDRCETPIPGVYAAGDVRSKFLHQVVTAVADGAQAAESAAEYLAI